LPQTTRKSIQRRDIVAIVCFVYAVYWAVILRQGLLQGHRNLTTWLIGAMLWLLFYVMAVGQSWARRLGLGVAIGGLILWPVGISWVYVFSFVGGGPFSLFVARSLRLGFSRQPKPTQCPFRFADGSRDPWAKYAGSLSFRVFGGTSSAEPDGREPN
jgi:hypothetical protein